MDQLQEPGATSKESWWDIPRSEPKRLAEALQAHTGAIVESQSWREQTALRNACAYLGTQFQSMTALQRHNWDNDSNEAPATFIMQAVRTSVARIAGTQKPVCIVQTNGADFRVRVQSRKCTKFLAGQFNEQQGEFDSIYDLGRTMFRDQEIFGEGVAKVQPNYALKKVDVARKFPWLIFYDIEDSAEGFANSIYEKMPERDVELLCAANPDKSAQIRAAAHKENGGTRKITVWEAYSKPRSRDKPGRRVIFAGETIILDEDFTRDTFPYVWMIGERSLFGQYGMSNVAFASEWQRRASDLFDGMYETTNLNAGGFIDVEKGAYPGTKGIHSLTSNKRMKLLERNKSFQPANITFPAPFNQYTLQFAERMRSMVMEIYAVSDFMAQGRKEPGIDSAIGLRNLNEIQNQNFLPKSLMYESFFPRAGRQMLFCAQDMARALGKSELRANLPSSGGFIESIDWESLGIGEETLYEVTIKPASANADDYSAKLEMVQEFEQKGLWDANTSARLIASLNPDVTAEVNRTSGQYYWVERIIEEILEADYVGGDVPVSYESPDPFMSLLDALKQMRDAYLEISSWPRPKSVRDRAMFEKRRQAMRAWMKETIELIKRGQGDQAPPPGVQPAPMGAPQMPGAPPGGAPPGAPMLPMPPGPPGQ